MQRMCIARYMTWPDFCLFVCLSIISRCSIERAEWIEVVHGTEATLGLSYTMLQRNSVSPKVRVLPSGTLSQTLNLSDFSAFFATARRPSQVRSTQFDRRKFITLNVLVYNTLIVTQRFVCDSWHLFNVLMDTNINWLQWLGWYVNHGIHRHRQRLDNVLLLRCEIKCLFHRLHMINKINFSVRYF